MDAVLLEVEKLHTNLLWAGSCVHTLGSIIRRTMDAYFLLLKNMHTDFLG